MWFTTTENAASEIYTCLLNLNHERLKKQKGKIYIETFELELSRTKKTSKMLCCSEYKKGLFQVRPFLHSTAYPRTR